MFLPWSALTVVMVVLTGAVAGAQPIGGGARVRKEQRFVLPGGEEAPKDRVLRLAPGVVTTVLFDTPILPASVDRERLGGLFTRLVVEPDVLVLKPAEAMPREDPPRLTVRFADEAAPATVTFLLTTDAREVDASVEVLRQPASAEELAARLKELSARCAATEAGLGALRRQCALSGLAGVILSGVVGEAGVSARIIRNGPVRNGIETEDPYVLFHAQGWAALALVLHNPPAAAPWGPGVARLRRKARDGLSEGPALEVPVHLLVERLEPGQRARVVVEWPLEAGALPEEYMLEIVDGTGSRGVRWERLVR